jgi:hypothetical protein
MIVRSLIRAQAPRIASRRVFRIPSRTIRTTRRYSTSGAPPMASSTPQNQASMLATITTDLDKIAPRFELQPDQITIIQTPTEFYETLKVGAIPWTSAFLCSLYLVIPSYYRYGHKSYMSSLEAFRLCLFSFYPCSHAPHFRFESLPTHCIKDMTFHMPKPSSGSRPHSDV